MSTASCLGWHPLFVPCGVRHFGDVDFADHGQRQIAKAGKEADRISGIFVDSGGTLESRKKMGSTADDADFTDREKRNRKAGFSDRISGIWGLRKPAGVKLFKIVLASRQNRQAGRLCSPDWEPPLIAFPNLPSNLFHLRFCGGIAQLVERQLCKLDVRGSNPLASKERLKR